MSILSRIIMKSIPMKSSSKRIVELDYMKGITIILMIIGHTVGGELVHQFIYSFHMPLFFLVSGFCFKKSTIKQYITKNVKRLLTPYFVTSVIISFSNIFISAIQGGRQFKSSFFVSELYRIFWGIGSSSIKVTFAGMNVEPIGGLWFLLAMFWAGIILTLILKISSEIIQLIVILSLLVVGMSVGQTFWLPLSFLPSLVAVSYMWIGYITKKYELLERVKTSTCLVGYVIWGVAIAKGHISMSSNQYGGVLSWLGAIAATICIYKLFSILKYEYIMPFLKILSYLGTRTLAILCFHIIELDCIPLADILNACLSNHVNLIVIVFRFLWITICLIVMERSRLLQCIYK